MQQFSKHTKSALRLGMLDLYVMEFPIIFIWGLPCLPSTPTGLMFILDTTLTYMNFSMAIAMQI